MTKNIAYLKANKMIKLEVSKEQYARAENLYEFKALNNSITKGKSNIFGAIGEIMVNDYFINKGADVNFTSTYDYDMIIDGYRIDVKSKKTTVVPKQHYLCSISNFNTNQNCDFYFFTRINENLKYCYLLGYKKKSDFFNESVFNKKGSLDVNGWSFKSDCYNLKISKLVRFKQ
jgi:hypothetical protein